MRNLINVINLHFTDFCNYHCFHCFVNKENNRLSFKEIKKIVDKVKKYFKKYSIKDARINLAGGEPMTSSYLQEIIDYIYEKNISVSLITNGHFLTEEFIEYNARKLKTIGISVDTLDESKAKLIGRCQGDATLKKERLVELCRYIKMNEIKLKINICLSTYNYSEDFSDFLEAVKPDRLKILELTIVEGINELVCKNKPTKEQLNLFIENHKKFNPIIETENEIKDSYLIIDSLGNMSTTNNHKSEFSVLKLEIDDILKKIDFSSETFNNRYRSKSNQSDEED